MKWVTMLFLTTVLGGCAHHFRDRQVSSVEEIQQDQRERRQSIEPHGSRY